MVAAPTAPKETPVAPDFHVWLAERVQLDERRVRRLSLDAGLRAGHIRELLKTGSHPLPKTLDQIAAMFDAPAEWVRAWRERAVEKWGAAGKSAGAILSRAGMASPEMLPCADCGEPFLASDYKRKVRRCKVCRSKRGLGSKRKGAAKNRGAAFVDGLLSRRGQSRQDFSVAIGMSANNFPGATQKTHWYPKADLIARMEKELELAPGELLKQVNGTWEGYYKETWPLRAEVHALADNADRAARKGTRYKRRAEELVEEGDPEALREFRDELLAAPREVNRAGTEAAANASRGRPRSPEVVERAAAGERAMWARRSPSERKARAAHLHTLDVRLIISLTLWLRGNPSPSRSQLEARADKGCG